MFDYFSRYSRMGFLAVLIAGLAMAKPANAEDPPQADLNWQSPARLHRGLRKERGTLVINGQGVEFRSEGKFSHSWPYIEIQTFDLAPHRFILTSYENRGKHLPGDRRFRFDFSADMTPGVAAELARLVAKPVRNAEPDASRAAFDSIPARHTTRTGGTSGVLRFHDGGIDYVTASKQDGRSWRWSDIQTLANPDPYHFRVAGYRETFDFELKQPMSRELFDRLWDYVYTRDSIVSRVTGGNSHETEANK